MQTCHSRLPDSLRVSLSPQELGLILGAIADTLEERRQPYSRIDLARLVRLHRRLDLIGLSDQPEYAIRNGAVVSARDPARVVVPVPGSSRRTTQLAVSHGWAPAGSGYFRCLADEKAAPPHP